jgi:hypothetical protein
MVSASWLGSCAHILKLALEATGAARAARAARAGLHRCMKGQSQHARQSAVPPALDSWPLCRSRP